MRWPRPAGVVPVPQRDRNRPARPCPRSFAQHPDLRKHTRADTGEPAQFGLVPGPVLFDRVCHDNGIKHLLTAPYSPTTTGKIERLHKTIRAEFLTVYDGQHASVAELQAALDAWVVEYNTERPHQSCGGRPPVERFALADRSLTVVDEPEPVQASISPPRMAPRPAGVSRWVDQRGQVSLAGFHYRVGATFAGEPVEAVVAVADGLVEVLHAGVLVATHAQRLRPDQADGPPGPSPPSAGPGTRRPG